MMNFSLITLDLHSVIEKNLLSEEKNWCDWRSLEPQCHWNDDLFELLVKHFTCCWLECDWYVLKVIDISLWTPCFCRKASFGSFFLKTWEQQDTKPCSSLLGMCVCVFLMVLSCDFMSHAFQLLIAVSFQTISAAVAEFVHQNVQTISEEIPPRWFRHYGWWCVAYPRIGIGRDYSPEN